MRGMTCVPWHACQGPAAAPSGPTWPGTAPAAGGAPDRAWAVAPGGDGGVFLLCRAGRSLSLLDPTYASKYIPIIASVSEHQPPSWPSYFTDLQARMQKPL